MHRRIFTLTMMVVFMLIAGSHPAGASWHPVKSLPGLHSGKDVAITVGAVVGAVVVTTIVVYKLKHRNHSDTKLDVPATLRFDRASQNLVLFNLSRNTVTIQSAVFRGHGFEFSQPLETPALVDAGKSLEIPIRMTHAGRARLDLTYIEKGRRYIRRIALRGGAQAAAIREPAPPLQGAQVAAGSVGQGAN